MDSAGWISIVGIVSTATVAGAGYWFNERRAKADRETNRQLAQDAHTHERQLAEQAQGHERQVRQGERAYDDRKTAYRRVVAWGLRTMQQIQLSEPILKTSGMPDEPPPDLDEGEWDAMMIEVRLFGSSDVIDAMEKFRSSAIAFSAQLMAFRVIRDQRGQPPWQELEETRQAASSSFDGLTDVIRNELASL